MNVPGVIIYEYKDEGFVAVPRDACEPALYGIALATEEQAVEALIRRLAALAVRGLRYYDHFGHRDDFDAAPDGHDWQDVTTHGDVDRELACTRCDGRRREPREEAT